MLVALNSTVSWNALPSIHSNSPQCSTLNHSCNLGYPYRIILGLHLKIVKEATSTGTKMVYNLRSTSVIISPKMSGAWLGWPKCFSNRSRDSDTRRIYPSFACWVDSNPILYIGHCWLIVYFVVHFFDACSQVRGKKTCLPFVGLKKIYRYRSIELGVEHAKISLHSFLTGFLLMVSTRSRLQNLRHTSFFPLKASILKIYPVFVALPCHNVA